METSAFRLEGHWKSVQQRTSSASLEKHIDPLNETKRSL
jgi:hypothetical protein